MIQSKAIFQHMERNDNRKV